MRTISLALIAAVGLALASCDDQAYRQAEEPAAIEPAIEPAPAAEDAGMDAASTTPATPPPTDRTALPPDQRSSEESVQPESETLFY